MTCYEGFDEKEAQEARICSDCKIRYCKHHPEFAHWRLEQGLGPRKQSAPKELHQFFVPKPQLPKPSRRGFKRGRIFRDLETSRLMGKVLAKMKEVAQIILNEEDFIGWQAVTKKGVWATHCCVKKKHVQFGEGCVLCHLEGGTDTVRKEMRRFGWEYTSEKGWMMVVIHEIAHALDHRMHNHLGHGPLFHKALKVLRMKYYARFVGIFENIRMPTKIAANKAI